MLYWVSFFSTTSNCPVRPIPVLSFTARCNPEAENATDMYPRIVILLEAFVLMIGIVRDSENEPVEFNKTGPRTCPELLALPFAGMGGFAIGQRLSGMAKVTSLTLKFVISLKLMSYTCAA
jgi:hypothetical protein